MDDKLLSKIDKQKVPGHVAIIMDGNGRWARQKGQERVFGHENGVEAVRDTVEGAVELGIKYLTLYAFSTENWNRPRNEVDALMELLVSTIHQETPTLNKNGVKLHAIGDIEGLPGNCSKELKEAIEVTKNNKNLTLILALSYSSRWEIVETIKNIARQVKDGSLSPDQINEKLVDQSLNTKGIPDPELLIRTSGEQRVSNFLLWQIAYSEFYFTDTLWPDFRRENLAEAIIDYQKRERRFGLTSDQLTL